ncbi:MAG: protease inhibitor I42 family protein [Chloroflexota bacterium]
MKRFLYATLVLVVLLTACSSSQAKPQPTNPEAAIEADAGKEFTLVLESNPTTGYHWEIVGDLDGAVVEFVGQEYQSTSQPGLAGGGGLDIWTFKAVGAGETTITLGHYPPSNDPIDPEETQTFTVIVK